MPILSAYTARNSPAVRAFMREVESLINEECTDDIGRCLFVPVLPALPAATVH